MHILKRVLMFSVLMVMLLTIFMSEGCGMRKLITSEETMANAHMEQIIEALKKSNKEAVKAIFSNRALQEAKDMDEGLDYLFDLIKGDVLSWEKDVWTSGEAIENGTRVEEIRAWYKVTTSQKEYLFFLVDCTQDTANPDNVGVYTLRAIKAEDKETEFTYWQDMKIPGIYKPGETK